MKYSHSDWNGKTGTIPVFWNKEHYINLGWYEHEDKTHGFSTDSENYKIYGNNIGVLIPAILDPIFEQAFDFFDLAELVFSLSRYTPGMLLPWHRDNYPTYSRNKQVADPGAVVDTGETYIILRFEYDDLKDTQREYRDQFTKTFM